MALTIVGLCVLLYPSAASWFSARVHATAVNGYVHDVAALDDDVVQGVLAAAHEYNDRLPDGPLRDPYALDADGSQSEIAGGRDGYEQLLGGLPGDVMARIRIPTIAVDLPVFHGTDENTLAQGAGHLYGSGLPVGGEGTHSVLTAHSGLVNSTLFTDLHELQLGDVFTVTVLNEVLYYSVDQILTVEPNQTDALRQIAGGDYVTLVTCTPIGINSHRLLVRGERIEPPAAGSIDRVAVTDDVIDPGFPWWVIGLLAGVLVILVLTRPRSGRAQRTRDAAPEESQG
ncbi:class C sortase [Microbacterium abyssi]|uniref:class C sortase n=1 Tax=Microbacterium abyssi TaxID=2782166 RepID=UPI001E364ED7|nr:class C sortase [Microbacterium sp. A18JL241]